MRQVLRYAAAALTLLAGVLTVSYLQHRFDRADVHHAVDAVRLARPDSREADTVEAKLVSRYGLKPEEIAWDAHIESKWRGIVRIKASSPRIRENLVWKVDLVNLQVSPATAEAQELAL